MLIKPYHVAAFSGGISINMTKKRDIPLPECIFHCCSFTSARYFAGLKNNPTAIGNDTGIMRIDGIQSGAVVYWKQQYFDPFCFKQIHQVLMFANRGIQRWFCYIVQLFPLSLKILIADECFLRTLQDDPAQRSSHFL